jgi:hypothetical protein
MTITRRDLLAVAGSVPLTGLALGRVPVAPGNRRLPFKDGFAATDIAYLDSGSQHPLSLGALAAVQSYLAKRTLDPAAADYDRDDGGLLEKYARLVNADVDEVTFVQSTTTGEQMILRALGLPETLADNFVLKCYESGHSIYSDEITYPLLTRDIRSFISGAGR